MHATRLLQSLLAVAVMVTGGCAVQRGTGHPSAPQRGASEHEPGVEPLRAVAPAASTTAPATPAARVIAADPARCRGSEDKVADCVNDCWKDDDAACASLVQACEEGDGAACGYAASYLVAHHRRPSADPARLVRYLDVACGGGVLGGCIWLARLYTDGGSGVRKDAALAGDAARRATEHSRSQCERGDAHSCVALGSFAKLGSGMATNRDVSRRAYAKGFEILTAACAAGDGLQCHMLGVYYFDGTGTPVDRAKARAFLKRACSLPWKDAAASCSTLEQRFGGEPPEMAAP